MKKNDIRLIVVSAAAVLALFLIRGAFRGQEAAERVVVYRGKERIGEFSLHENRQEDFQDASGGNRILIQGGSVRIMQADCPDQLCVRQGAIFESGQTIICLPHHLVVAIEGGEPQELDGMTQ